MTSGIENHMQKTHGLKQAADYSFLNMANCKWECVLWFEETTFELKSDVQLLWMLDISPTSSVIIIICHNVMFCVFLLCFCVAVADVPLSGSKKLDGVREPVGSLRTNQGSHKQPPQSSNRRKSQFICICVCENRSISYIKTTDK